MKKLWLADAHLDGIKVSLTFSAQNQAEAELVCDERGWILLGEHVEIELTEEAIEALTYSGMVH